MSVGAAAHDRAKYLLTIKRNERSPSREIAAHNQRNVQLLAQKQTTARTVLLQQSAIWQIPFRLHVGLLFTLHPWSTFFNLVEVAFVRESGLSVSSSDHSATTSNLPLQAAAQPAPLDP